MPSSNNANAGMGNSSTKSNNASAAPTIISGGGPTPTPTSGALAIFDFSAMPNQDLKVTGSYTIPVSGGSTSATTAQIQVFKGNTGIGANGIQRINNGFLEFLPDIVTSEFGAEYWSATSCPFLGIDLRTLSTRLNTVDTKFQELIYEMVVEIVPQWESGTRKQWPIYCYMYTGFLHGLDTWASAGTPRPNGLLTGQLRTTTSSNTSRDQEAGGIGFIGTSISRTSYALGSISTATAPFNTYGTGDTSKLLRTTWDGNAGSITHWNGSAALRRYPNAANGTFQTFTPPSTFDAPRGSNNLWAVFYSSRSTSSIQGGDVPYRIKKVTIYERSLG
jgi:hypothetical protein